MKKRLQQMMEGLLTRQEEVAARHEEAAVQAAVSLNEFKEDINGLREALLKEMRSCEKRTTASKLWSVACPEKSRADPKEMEADVVTFEERSNKMEATTLEENSEAREAVVEW
jgi:hypothetical protein